MDKSQPAHGRDGHISFSTYGSRDKGTVSAGPDRSGKMVKPAKIKQDALKALNKAFKTEETKPVWDKPNPVKHSDKLSPAQKAKAKARARSAGRPYPNMVDNIWAARNEQMGNPYTEVLEQIKDMCGVCGQTPCNCTHIEEAKATMCGRCGTKHIHPSQGGKCPAVKEEVMIDEARIETDSGTANVTDTHVNFNNSGFRRKFTHQEIHKMDKGETVRGFKNEKDHPYADKHTSVYSDGDEEHHLPNHAKKSVSEERIVEVKTSTLQSYLQKRSAGRIKSAAATIFKGKDSPEVKSHEKREAGMERARKKLAPHYAAQAAERAKKQREELKKNNPPHEVKKRLDAAKAEYERSYGPVEKAGHNYAEGNGYYRGKELHSKYHALKQLHKEVSEETINEFIPAVLAALGRGAGVAGRVLGPLAGSAASGALSAAGNAVSGIAQGVGTAVSGVAQGVGNAVGGIAQGVGNAVSGNGEEKKKKTTVSNTDYVKEAMSASHRFALALQRERERRELKDQARAAREAAGKTVSFTNYLKPKGPKDEKTN